MREMWVIRCLYHHHMLTMLSSREIAVSAPLGNAGFYRFTVGNLQILDQRSGQLCPEKIKKSLDFSPA